MDVALVAKTLQISAIGHKGDILDVHFLIWSVSTCTPVLKQSFETDV